MSQQNSNTKAATRSRASTNVSGVDILPIPPALDFPYPKEEPADEEAPSGRQELQDAPESSSHDYFGPPKKSATTPMAPIDNPLGRSTDSPRPGLLQRIGSAPIRASSQKNGGTGRPGQHRHGSILHRLPSKKDGGGAAFFNPDFYSDHEESSSDDSSDEERRQSSVAQHGQLRRTATAPNRQSSSSDPYKRFAFGNDGYKTRGHVSKHDGRLNISLRETANKGYLAKALGASLDHHLRPSRHAGSRQPSVPLRREDRRRPQPYRLETASTISDLSVDDPDAIPKLNIVVMVIGSRGDIQPFLRLGKLLKEEHGHRVRIATHPTFKDFVENDAKLEFFDVGGDPAELMAFMVKNPGLIPKSETLRSGEILRRRAQMFQMFQGFWRACVSSSDHVPDGSEKRLLEEKEPFVADAIIANPPCFAHIHCAERLGIPLHLMFTFPNTPTQQFPHPLTNIRQTNVDANYTNFMSYPLVEMMHWQGLGDLINEFRVRTLGLDPLSMLWAPGQIFRMKVPYSYLWSPGLIPKPPDWGEEINITGFVFLDLASSFKPPEALAKFLDEGEPPVYIGFGSIVVDDPDKFTNLVFQAVRKAGVRALVSKGWGGLGGEIDCPDNIFLLDNTPHDWLFPRVSAVVHHGGAGTTAIGLKCGKPTMIVPFFGDQPFWGAMVAKANAGAEPVPYKELSADRLAESIKLLLTEEKQRGAQALAERIAREGDGAANAVKSFHKHLPRRGLPNMRCSILKNRVASWHVKGSEVRLSTLAAHMLVQQQKLSWNDLRLYRVYDWNDFEGPGEPVTGMGSSLFEGLIGIGAGVGKTPYRWAKIIKQKEARDRKRKAARRKKLQADIRERDKAYRKQKKEDAKLAAEAEVARHKRDPAADGNNGDAGIEARLPSGNQPDGLTQCLSHSANRGQSLRNGEDPRAPKQAAEDLEDSENDSENDSVTEILEQLAAETGRGARKSGAALAKLPMNLLLSLARGLHNAPRLYGDDTVRTTHRITGFHSGCRAAGAELLYGVFDGWTGLVRQPYMGAKYNGTPGFFKGVGKGVGGFLIKDAAAIFGIPAYTMKGVHMEMTKYRQPTAFVRHARFVEGAQQFAQLSEEDQQRIGKQVADSWDVVEDVNVEIRKTIKEKGFRGRVEVWRNRKWLKENGIMENVRGMQRALDAHREGRNWEVEFREEKERTQREQAEALRTRKDARKKKYARDEDGKRIKGADVRMKTRHGAYRSLKKAIKRTEKLALRKDSVCTDDEDPAAAAAAPAAANEQAETRPRARTLMADESTGTTAIDQAGLAETKKQGERPEPPQSPSKMSSSTDNTAIPGEEGGHGFDVSQPSPRKRHDSGDTLVQSGEGANTAAAHSPKTRMAGFAPVDLPGKMSAVPEGGKVGAGERGLLPRMETV